MMVVFLRALGHTALEFHALIEKRNATHPARRGADYDNIPVRHKIVPLGGTLPIFLPQNQAERLVLKRHSLPGFVNRGDCLAQFVRLTCRTARINQMVPMEGVEPTHSHEY